MNRSLITGGCGFVGRHLTHRLLSLGHEVWVIDNLSTGWHTTKWAGVGVSDTWNGFERHSLSYGGGKLVFIQADLMEVLLPEVLGRTSDKELLPEFDLVFHLASIVGGRALIDGDPLLVGLDLGIDSTFFVWASRKERLKKLNKVMFASSSAAYPIHLQSEDAHVALREPMISFDENLGMPDMTYGWSKLTGEFLAQLAHERYGMHVSCVRPFSGYGEDQDVSYPVPAIARRIARRENPVEVWGTGKQGRDFVYIEDCIDAMLLVIDKVQDGRGLNIGTGKLTSFLELIGILSEIEGYTPEIKTLTDKPVGVQSRYGIADELRALGWEPKTSLHDGMSLVLDYARNAVREG